MSSPDEHDLIEVRPDERFDEIRLGRYLRDRLPGALGEMTVRQFSGGKANLTYLLTLANRRNMFAPAAIGRLCAVGA